VWVGAGSGIKVNRILGNVSYRDLPIGVIECVKFLVDIR
jgi:hypothetical protein